MKNFFLFLFFLISFFRVSFLHSETIPLPIIYNWFQQGWCTSGVGYDSPTATANAFIACAAGEGVPLKLCGINVFIYVAPVSDPDCALTPTYQGPYLSSSTGSCPVGFTLDPSGDSCSRPDCPSGTIRLTDGSCGRDCDSLKNTSYSGYIPASANPGAVCQDGCSATVVNASNQASVDGQQVIAGTFSYTGSSCTGNNITGGTPPVCPAGQCVAQINGANACFTCSSVNQSATTYTATSDSTIKTTIYNADDSVTTSVTDTSSGTTSPSITTQKTEQQTYCEQNPSAITCIDTDDQPVTPVEPSLENSPSGASIFSAIKDFVQIQPSNFSHTSQCPTSSFDWNGHSYIINQHCALVTDHWAILSIAMMTAWTVLSLFVVLKA